MGCTNPSRALQWFLLRLIFLSLLILFGISVFFIYSFRLPPPPLSLLVGLNLSFLTGAVAWFLKIIKVAPFESVEMFRKDPYLTLFFSLSFNDLPALLLISVSVLGMLITWPSGLLSLLLWRLHKELWFDWSTGMRTGVFLLIQINMKPPSRCIPIKIIFQHHFLPINSTLLFNPTPTFLGITFDRTLSFLSMCFCWRPSSFLVSRPYTVSLLLHRAPFMSLLSFVQSSSSSPSPMLHPDGFLFLALPSWSAFTIRLVAPSPAAFRPPISNFFWSASTSLTNHSDSFRPVILWECPSSPNLLSHLIFRQTWSEAKTLQILLLSFCLHSLALVFSCFFYENSLGLFSFSSLEPAFFIVELTLSALCSLFDPPISWLSLTLILSHLSIWWSGLIALFLSPLARAIRTSLPTAHFETLRPPFPIRQT